MKAAALCVLLLAGCQTVPPATVIGSAKAIEVPVVLTKPCIDAAQIPPLPANAMPARDSDIKMLANGVAANSERLLDVIQTQRKLLEACAQLQGAK